MIYRLTDEVGQSSKKEGSGLGSGMNFFFFILQPSGSSSCFHTVYPNFLLQLECTERDVMKVVIE